MKDMTINDTAHISLSLSVRQASWYYVMKLIITKSRMKEHHYQKNKSNTPCCLQHDYKCWHTSLSADEIGSLPEAE